MLIELRAIAVPPPFHPFREVVKALRLAVPHLAVRHDDAAVHAARVAAVTGIHIIRDLGGGGDRVVTARVIHTE